MKTGKRSGTIAATVAASLALALCASAPAAATPSAGDLWCTSFMQARVTFTSTAAGKFYWDTTNKLADGSWTTSAKTTHTYYASHTGHSRYIIAVGFNYSNVIATCV